MKQYTSLLQELLDHAEPRVQSRGMPSRSLFGRHLSFDLRNGFPMVTVKHVPFKSVIAELVGFIDGVQDTQGFNDLGTKIWDANANAPQWVDNPNCKYPGDLGRIYSAQWRQFRSLPGMPTMGAVTQNPVRYTDQLAQLVHELADNPQSRRHLVSAWNPGEIDQMALPPCHVMFQCYVSNDGYLDLQMYQRSCDAFLGLPFNIASYAALLTYLAAVCGYKPRHLKITLGDVHLYENQIEGAALAVSREPLPLPQLKIRTESPDLAAISTDLFILEGYLSHPSIPVEMVV